MTKFEANQPNSVFVNAGRNAFKAGIHFLNNPYKDKPYRTLWEKGYMAESRKYRRK